MEMDLGFFAILIIIFGVVSFVYGFKAMYRFRMISDIPKSKIRSIALGLVEIHGMVAEDKLMKTPISKTDCVYYKLEVKEYKKKSAGKNGSTYTWETIHVENKIIPFYAKDETGKVYVIPNYAEFDLLAKKIYLLKHNFVTSIKSVFSFFKEGRKITKEAQSKGINDDNEIAKEISKKFLDFDSSNLTLLDSDKKFYTGTTVGDRKFYEYYLEPEENIYILGSAFNDRSKENNLVIKKGENDEVFIISNKDEEELLKTFKRRMIKSFVFGGLGILLGIFLLLTYIFM